MESKRRSLLFLSVASSISMYALAALTPANAQVVPDGTLGAESSVVTPNVTIKDLPSNRIDGGAIRGTNLFHSFQEFSIGAGQGAYFANPAGIENILSRVTGTNPSNIQGTLGVLGNANLFLFNPRGIVFGRNAKLDVGGSFVASTASAVVFADGSFFSATDPSSLPLLTITMPIGLQYREMVGSIQVQGSKLQVPTDKTLALVGGNLSLDGASIKTPEGRVELAGVAGLGTLGVEVNNNDLSLSFPSDLARADISVTNKAVIDVSGEGGGAVQFQGRQVTLSNESQVFADTLGERDGQGISIQAVQLTIQGGTQLSASTSGSGQGGNVEVNASDSVELIGTSANGQKPSKFDSDVLDASGDAGGLTITTRRLIIRDGARISASASGTGEGGDITIKASDSVELIGTSPGDRRPSGVSVQTSRGIGKAGDITITTRQLSIRNGAEVSAATFGDGDGGTVEVNASDSVELSGTSTNGRLRSRLFAGTGKPSDVSSPDRGDVPEISTGDGGELIVKTRQLTVRDGAQISVGSQGSGNASNLEVSADSIRLDNKASISADTTSTSPDPLEGQGNIILRSEDLVLRRGSNIITEATGTTKGGDINIETGVLVALEDSDINANAKNSFGGRVIVNAQGIFGTTFRDQNTPLSDITATSELGPSFSGTVTINTPGVDPSRGLVALPETVVDPAALIAQNPCQRGKGSAFVVTGRGGLPTNPSEVLSTDAIQVGLVEPALINSRDRQRQTITSDAPSIESSTSPVKNSIVPAQGWVFNNKGEVILTAVNPNSTLLQRPWVNPSACRVP
jgi:filamentous hemagglutinin family protein